ncbi:conserved exported hypothetical protein [Sphingomonas sp. EC-HK361]|uniref:DUF3089 domain-containing protein n=1 Tax=Sphingomonas sp. EC-HK361 TaxID=2038397 RepID=UPI0012560E9A|nr:DUF3089 domain-containing protein [Sphingomonas sp. EC-HK361]VVS96729.1 conserved exported hypothetical protein [Sphingomonas sp. EC-HK361]
MRGTLIRNGTLAAVALAGASAASAQILQALKISRNNQPPPFAFGTKPPPAPVDYARASSWAALPTTRDEADVSPLGVRPGDQTRAPAEVFFIYPTVLMSRTQWNADPRDAALNAKIDATTIRGQASAFNDCCAVYAPRYRQMTLGGYIRWSDGSARATELAYGDVARAFRQFLAWNKGRPFIIAGHSQGSRLGRLLIEREIAGKPIARRMVAAYLIGHWIEADWFRRLGGITPCQRGDDTGCVVTFSTFAQGRDGAAQRRFVAEQSHYAPEAIRRPYVGINPFTWTTSGAVSPKSADLGSWIHGPGAEPAVADVGLVTGRMKDGALYISPPGKRYAALMIPFGNFHNVDYSIAYMNLRENAARRVAAFRGR